MYFATVEGRTGDLAELRMIPMRIEKMRLHRASPADAEWLRARLTDVSDTFGSRIDMDADGSLHLRWPGGDT